MMRPSSFVFICLKAMLSSFPLVCIIASLSTRPRICPLFDCTGRKKGQHRFSRKTHRHKHDRNAMLTSLPGEEKVFYKTTISASS
ncbi:hypothetical protein DIPPA_33014 [Diplonema papillatum]|nr:hypothetical protein DIPPA_33014 [Diplonema papillatum]